MKTVNIIVQSLFIIVTLIFSLLTHEEGKGFDLFNAFTYFLFFYLLFITIMYQIFNGIIIFCSKKSTVRLKSLIKIYWIVTVFYLLALMCNSIVMKQAGNSDLGYYYHESDLRPIWFIAGWGIALYYFIICLFSFKRTTG